MWAEVILSPVTTEYERVTVVIIESIRNFNNLYFGKETFFLKIKMEYYKYVYKTFMCIKHLIVAVLNCTEM